MKTRTILIFPELDNVEIIQQIREKYDPLADLIRPHITLVFPFESELTDQELERHIRKCISDIQPFYVELCGYSKQEDKYGNYLFLNVVKGMESLKKLHQQLYTGQLKEFDAGYDYVPHITVGKLKSKELMEEAYEKINQNKDYFTSYVKRISVEMVGEHEESIILMEHEL